jgi:uncharacterized protein (DUF885 family)
MAVDGREGVGPADGLVAAALLAAVSRAAAEALVVAVPAAHGSVLETSFTYMKYFSLLTLAVALAACSHEPKKEVMMPAKSLHDFLEQYYEERLPLYPLEATQAGDNRYNDLLPNDISKAFRDTLQAFYTRYDSGIRAYDRAKLSEQEQVSYDVFLREMQISLDRLKFPEHYMPVQQFWGMTLTMPQLGSGQGAQPFKTVKDYDNFLHRIDGFAVWMDTAIVNMRKGLATGYTFPKILMERVLPQAKDMMVKDVTKSIFWMPLTSFPDSIGAEDRKRLEAAYTQAIQEKIVPSYQKLYDFLQQEYIPHTRTTAGISGITQGADYYKFLVRYWTTTDLTPEEIHQTGLDEVKRIRTEMENIKNQTGFKGDLKQFFDYVNNDKKFMPYKTAEEVLDGFRAINTRMEPQLKKLFNLVPKSKFEVRQTEAFRAASASAEYNQGTPDGSRPGIFYVPILDAKTFNYTGMETLFLHEAIPGHHYQSSLQMENEELPRFRRFLWYGAYGEGWALYTESLGKELGLYTDPYQYFGHLGDGIHRAIRLVVDVGLHTKQWTREQAIQYMMENEPISEQGAVAEIERYMAIPGQALSYKIGQLKILALRKKASEALGDRFSVAAFHDEVLKYGCLPLDVLESRVDQWVAQQQKNQP